MDDLSCRPGRYLSVETSFAAHFMKKIFQHTEVRADYRPTDCDLTGYPLDKCPIFFYKRADRRLLVRLSTTWQESPGFSRYRVDNFVVWSKSNIALGPCFNVFKSAISMKSNRCWIFHSNVQSLPAWTLMIIVLWSIIHVELLLSYHFNFLSGTALTIFSFLLSWTS